MDAKSILLSKTFWANLLTVAIGMLGVLAGDDVVREHPRIVSALVTASGLLNILLRSVTDSPVSIVGPKARSVILACVVACGCGDVSAQITGPQRVGLGELVRVLAPAAADEAVLFEIIEPDELDSEEVPFAGGVKLLFSSGCKPGMVRITALTFRIADGKPSIKRDRITITVEGSAPTPSDPTVPAPPGPNQPPAPHKITQITYVYEKSQHRIPPAVAAALNRLNQSAGLLGSAFDQDTVDGTGTVPDQYRVALEAAKREGLPCLVVQAGDTVVRVKKSPTTEADVNEAVQ